MAVMELTKFGHACVRLEKDGRRPVIDPGGLTDPGALEGADAVLVTHERFDHFSEEVLRRAAAARPGLRIWTNSSVAKQLASIFLDGPPTESVVRFVVDGRCRAGRGPECRLGWTPGSTAPDWDVLS